jgi:hypothetical protein
MANHNFPALNASALVDTRDACHAYASVLGGWTTSCRQRRKHWWQLSLRPSLNGVTTGVIHADGVHFELALDLASNHARGEIAGVGQFNEVLGGQTAGELGSAIQEFLLGGGIDPQFLPGGGADDGHEALDGSVRAGYSAEIAAGFAQTWRELSAAYTKFQASIPEETSPINVWPGHFDMAMMWLGGEKIPGQDPANEEYSDKQMNFGFSFGDAGIPEPYFYITAYPLPDAFPGLVLPGGAYWHSEGFNGAVLRYSDLIERQDPQGALLELWHCLLDAGRCHMLENTVGV